MHVQSWCFANLNQLLFDVLLAVTVVKLFIIRLNYRIQVYSVYSLGWLGGSIVPTDEPPCRPTKIYTFLTRFLRQSPRLTSHRSSHRATCMSHISLVL